MKTLLSLALLLACNNGDAVRVEKLEAELKECRTQTPPQAAQGNRPTSSGAMTASTASVPSAAVAQAQFSTITVNHSQSWVGVELEFDYVCTDFMNDENFPRGSGGTREVAIAPLKLHREGEDSTISMEEALRRLDAQGMRPATAREARAYAKAFPERQREFSMVALGSSWFGSLGDRFVPVLRAWNGRRALDLYWTVRDWAWDWRFLAARK